MTTLEKIRTKIDYYLKNNEFGMEYRNDIKNIIDKYAEQEPKQPDICPIYDGMCGYPIEFCYECPRHPEQEPSDTIAYHDDFATALIKISEYEDRKRCEDAVSRQAVIDNIKNGFHWESVNGITAETVLKQVIHDVEIMPSVQPKTKTGHCKDCKWYDEDRIYNPNCENCCRNYEDNYCCARMSDESV